MHGIWDTGLVCPQGQHWNRRALQTTSRVNTILKHSQLWQNHIGGIRLIWLWLIYWTLVSYSWQHFTYWWNEMILFVCHGNIWQTIHIWRYITLLHVQKKRNQDKPWDILLWWNHNTHVADSHNIRLLFVWYSLRAGLECADHESSYELFHMKRGTHQRHLN